VTSSFVRWALLATILATALRIYHLSTASFWVDELNTVSICGQLKNTHMSKVFGYIPTYLGMWLSGVAVDEIDPKHPEQWRSKGVTETTARIGSAVFGILSIPLLGLFSYRMLGPRASIFFMFMLAVAPWHVYWSQAARFYTQQFLFYNLSLILYFAGTRNRSPGRMAAAVVLLLLAFLSQPPALVLVAVFALDWTVRLIRGEKMRLGMLGGVSAVGAGVVCLAILAVDIKRRPEQWTQFIGHLYQSPLALTLGQVYMVGPVVALFAVISAWWLLFRDSRLSIYLLLGAVVPAVVFAIVSTRSYVGLRYVFVSLYCWLALAAIGTDRIYTELRGSLGKILALSPLLVLLVGMLFIDYGYYTAGYGYHARWREALAYVRDHRREADAVCVNGDHIGQYYLQDSQLHKFPKTEQQLIDLNRRTWLATEGEDSIHGMMIQPWLARHGVLKAYYDLYVVQPRSSVQIFLYEPANETAG